MYSIFSAIAAIVMMCITLSAQAVNLPYSKHFEAKIDKKQYGYTDISINSDGKVTVNTMFSNGKRQDGDTFYAMTLFKDAKGQIVGSVFQVKGVNASGGGKAREARDVYRFKLNSKRAVDITSVTVSYGFKDKVDDAEYGRAISAIVSAVIASQTGGHWLNEWLQAGP